MSHISTIINDSSQFRLNLLTFYVLYTSIIASDVSISDSQQFYNNYIFLTNKKNNKTSNLNLFIY